MGAKNLLIVEDKNVLGLKIEKEWLLDFGSNHTRVAYKRDLEQFIEFITKRSPGIKSFNEVSRLDIVEFRNFLSETGGLDGDRGSAKTIRRKLGAVSSYFSFLVMKNFINSNPTVSVKRPKDAVKSPTQFLSKDQFENMLQEASKSSESGPLHYALVLTYFATGLRTSEILALKIKDLIKHDSGHALKYSGKGGKSGIKILHHRAYEAIEKYLSWMKSKKRSVHKEEWLFRPTKNPHDPNNLDRPLNPRTINLIFDKYAKKAGINKKVSAHSARATFITSLLDSGADIYSVCTEVNHSSVQTTQEYDKRLRKNDRSFVEKALD